MTTINDNRFALKSIHFLLILVSCQFCSITCLPMATSGHPIGIQDETSKQTFIEDFHADNSNVEVRNSDSPTVELAFTIPNDTDGQSTEEFYQKIVKNLKKKYPQMQKLRLRGGHVTIPSESNSTDALKSEIDHIVQTLNTIDKVVNENGIVLRRLVLTSQLQFENTNGVNLSELVQKSLKIDGEIRDLNGEHSISVPFKIQHGRGVLKLDVNVNSNLANRSMGRSRYFPVDYFVQHRGHGPQIGNASYDKNTNKTTIWTAKTGTIELEGDHMDSEELEEYFPRNFDNE